MCVSIAEGLPLPRRRQARQAGAARQAHEHRFDDVIQMVRGRDHAEAQRRSLLREELKARRTEFGFGREAGKVPSADDAGEAQRRRQGLHESRVAVGGFAPDAMIVMEDA